MTTLEITTEAPAQVALSVFVIAPINHTAVAQLLGDEEYDATLALTHDGQQAASAYHLAVQRYARAHVGQAAPLCECNVCRDEFGVKGGAL